MGSNTKIKPAKPRKPRLVITKNFLKDFESVLAYGSSAFGEQATQKFKEEIISRIKALSSFPHANPLKLLVQKPFDYLLNSFFIQSGRPSFFNIDFTHSRFSGLYQKKNRCWASFSYLLLATNTGSKV